MDVNCCDLCMWSVSCGSIIYFQSVIFALGTICFYSFLSNNSSVMSGLILCSIINLISI